MRIWRVVAIGSLGPFSVVINVSVDAAQSAKLPNPADPAATVPAAEYECHAFKNGRRGEEKGSGRRS